MDWLVKDKNGIGVWFMEKGLVILLLGIVIICDK